MAKGKIFIGEIMADMVNSLGSLETAMDSQVLKMDDQITELENINATVGRSVETGNVIAGTEDEIVMNDVLITVAPSAWHTFGTVKSFSNGKIKVSGSFYAVPSGQAQLYYSKNGAADVQIGGSIGSETPATLTADIVVAKYDEILIKMRNGSGGGSALCVAGSCKVGYKALNLSTDGFVVKL